MKGTWWCILVDASLQSFVRFNTCYLTYLTYHVALHFPRCPRTPLHDGRAESSPWQASRGPVGIPTSHALVHGCVWDVSWDDCHLTGENSHHWGHPTSWPNSALSGSPFSQSAWRLESGPAQQAQQDSPHFTSTNRFRSFQHVSKAMPVVSLLYAANARSVWIDESHVGPWFFTRWHGDPMEDTVGPPKSQLGPPSWPSKLEKAVRMLRDRRAMIYKDRWWRWISFAGWPSSLAISNTNRLPETNVAPENRPSERKVIFQPSISRCYVSFREGTPRTENIKFKWRNNQKSKKKNLFLSLNTAHSVTKQPFTPWQAGNYPALIGHRIFHTKNRPVAENNNRPWIVLRHIVIYDAITLFQKVWRL